MLNETAKKCKKVIWKLQDPWFVLKIQTFQFVNETKFLFGKMPSWPRKWLWHFARLCQTMIAIRTSNFTNIKSSNSSHLLYLLQSLGRRFLSLQYVQVTQLFDNSKTSIQNDSRHCGIFAAHAWKRYWNWSLEKRSFLRNWTGCTRNLCKEQKHSKDLWHYF